MDGATLRKAHICCASLEALLFAVCGAGASPAASDVLEPDIGSPRDRHSHISGGALFLGQVHRLAVQGLHSIPHGQARSFCGASRSHKDDPRLAPFLRNLQPSRAALLMDPWLLQCDCLLASLDEAGCIAALLGTA